LEFAEIVTAAGALEQTAQAPRRPGAASNQA
jgi:hypothetical protein